MSSAPALDDNNHLPWSTTIKIVGRGLTVFLTIGGIDQILRAYFPETNLPFVLFVSAAFNVWLLWELILVYVRPQRTRVIQTEEKSIDKRFGQAIVDWAQELYEHGRDQGVVDLRNRFSHTLHLLGFHELRQKLGEFAFHSASILDDQTTRAEILIDDMGWAVYLNGDTQDAIQNIKMGIEAASKARSDKPDQLGRLILAEAKGLRHLAVLTAITGGDGAEDYIVEAQKVLDDYPDTASKLLIRDRMQLLHSSGEVLCLQFGILEDGALRSNDSEGIAKVEGALEKVSTAAKTFQEIGDLERCAKAINLQSRMLSAIHRELEASEVRAKMNRILAASELLSYDRISLVGRKSKTVESRSHSARILK